MKKVIVLCLLLVSGPAMAEMQLIFFFAAGCQFCHKVAPVVKEAGEIYGLPVIANSLDGKGLPDFPDAIKDDRLTRAFKVHSLPMLAVVDTSKKMGKVLMVGAYPREEILKRLAIWVEKGI
jgi:conjugal transfer pilus assembly protein TraF